jgi:SAM-dependent methyltransferase
MAVRDINWKCPGEFTIVKCGACNLAYLSPAPAPEEFPIYYPPRYYTRASGTVRVTEDRRRWLERGFAYRADILERFQKPGKMLDVGCGDGHMIEHLKRRGWDVSGAEMSAAACDYAVRELKLAPGSIHCGNFLELPLPENSFDLITLYDVLEHMADPAAVIARCRALLRPAGGIFMQAPNFGSAGRRIFGQWWIHLDAPRHVVHFTPASLAGFMNGWDIVRLRTATGLSASYINGYSDSLRHWIRHFFPRMEAAPASGARQEPDMPAVAARNPWVGAERFCFSIIGAIADTLGVGEMIQLYARKR